MDVLSLFILAVWGMLVALLQERFGAFQNLTPRVKGLFNAAFAYVVPAVVIWVQPYWKLEFGDVNEVVLAALYILAPVVAWAVGQLFHLVDKNLTYGAKYLKQKYINEKK